jgi:hypothetical protein
MAGFDPFLVTVDAWTQGDAAGLEITDSGFITGPRLAGLQAGDRVLSVNGWPLDDFRALRKAERKTRRTDHCTYSVIRGRIPLVVHLELEAAVDPGPILLEILKPGDPGFPDLVQDVDEVRRISRRALWSALADPERPLVSIPDHPTGIDRLLQVPEGVPLLESLDLEPGDSIQLPWSSRTGYRDEDFFALLLLDTQVHILRSGQTRDKLLLDLVGPPPPQAETFVLENPSLKRMVDIPETRLALAQEENRCLANHWMRQALLEELLNEAAWHPALYLDEPAGLILRDTGPEFYRLGMGTETLVEQINGETPVSYEDIVRILTENPDAWTLQIRAITSTRDRDVFAIFSGESQVIEVVFNASPEPVSFQDRNRHLQATRTQITTESELGALAMIRVTMHKDSDGEVDGIRLSGIRRASKWSMMGFKNGDIVHRVNEIPLTSIGAGVKLGQLIEEADTHTRLVFQVTRRNQPMTITTTFTETEEWVLLPSDTSPAEE